jgi:hypothetical protein
MRRLKEPERWAKTAAERTGNQLGSYRELFGTPVWRRHAIVGLLLATSGVIGLWGIGFFSSELIGSVVRAHYRQQGLIGDEVVGKVTTWVAINSLLLNSGAFLGIQAFRRLTAHTGRRLAFAVSFVLAMLSTSFTFWFVSELTDILWMVPVMGFCQLAIFGGYAIYFPELFPTRLRSTGTSFCYNVGRYLAAPGPAVLGILASTVFGAYDEVMRWRCAGVTMCSIFLVGLFVLRYAPETKGQPLPE